MPISVKINGNPISTLQINWVLLSGMIVKTGINVSIMPGTKIGPKSIIGPSVCLMEDVEPNTMVGLPTPVGLKKKVIK